MTTLDAIRKLTVGLHMCAETCSRMVEKAGVDFISVQNTLSTTSFATVTRAIFVKSVHGEACHTSLSQNIQTG